MRLYMRKIACTGTPEKARHWAFSYDGTGKGPERKPATRGYTVYFDFTKGSRPPSGYLTLAFADGSRIWFTFEGNSAVNAKGVTSIEGKNTIIRGEGRYDGIKGSSVYKGQRVSFMEGSGETYYDPTFRFTLPTQ